MVLAAVRGAVRGVERREVLRHFRGALRREGAPLPHSLNGYKPMTPEPGRSTRASPCLPEALKLRLRQKKLVPLDLLTEALPHGLFVRAAQWTNEYAVANGTPRQRRDWFPTTAGELKVWLSIMVHMGLCRHPSTKAYWHTDMHTMHASTVMTSSRWHAIKRFIKFNEVHQASLRHNHAASGRVTTARIAAPSVHVHWASRWSKSPPTRRSQHLCAPTRVARLGYVSHQAAIAS